MIKKYNKIKFVCLNKQVDVQYIKKMLSELKLQDKIIGLISLFYSDGEKEIRVVMIKVR